MFILLPQEQRDFLLKQYHMRLGIVTLFLFSGLVFIALILLVPSYFLAKGERNEILQERKTIEQSIDAESDQDIERALSELNNNISILNTPDQEPSSLISFIIENKSKSIHLNAFLYKYSPEESTLSVSGRADSRKELLAFSKKLQSNSEFKEVDLPISNLAKDSNIPFTINITGAF